MEPLKTEGSPKQIDKPFLSPSLTKQVKKENQQYISLKTLQDRDISPIGGDDAF